MRTKQCEVVQDLLPLYIDDVCSDESRRIITEHLKSCKECRELYENMSSAERQNQAAPRLDSEQAFRVISHKWKRKRVAIACVSVVVTAILVLAGCMVYQEVSGVHDFFSPVTYANLRNLPEDEWRRVSFQNSDVLVFDSIFYEKEVTLDGNCDGAVSIRICDNQGTLVLGESLLEPGTSLDLDMLERNTEYTVEIRTAADFVFLRFH